MLKATGIAVAEYDEDLSILLRWRITLLLESKKKMIKHCLVYSMMTRMDRNTWSKFHLYKANQVLGSGADVVLLSPLQCAQSTGKTSPPHCSQEPPNHPWGQVTFQTAQAQTNSAALQDNRLLEPREKWARHNFCHQNWEYIWSERLRQIPSLLCISASLFLQLCKAWHEALQKCRKSRSRNAESYGAEMQKVTEQNGKTRAK